MAARPPSVYADHDPVPPIPFRPGAIRYRPTSTRRRKRCRCQKGDRVATTLPVSILIRRSSQRAAISSALPSARST